MIQKLFFLWFCLLAHGVQARTWTDINGKAIEADILRADITSVTVRFNGKEVKIPLVRLSEKDQNFVDEWLKSGSSDEEEDGDNEEEPAKATTEAKPTPMPSGNKGGESNSTTFDGKPLETSGKVNLYDYEYDPERLKQVSEKFKSTDTGYKIGLAVPANFDPSKPQKVFIAMTAVNNDGQARSGNTGAMRTYARQCAEAGWVCLAYDTNIGVAKHNSDIYACFELLNRVWPGVKGWQFSVGGFSGGSKACFDPCAYLLKEEYSVVGAYLGGCNADHSQFGKDRYKTSAGSYKKLKIYMSTGDKDGLVKEPQRLGVVASLKGNGMRNVKDVVFDGGHSFYQTHFIEALKWFEASEE
jgi:hypothetical protein